MTESESDSESVAESTDARQPWTWGVGHNYISLFLSALFLDRLAAGTLDVGGLLPSIVGAALGGLLAFGLLYFPAATWGLQCRGGIDRVTSATFGEQGGRWLPNVLMALANVVWFAACLAMAADYGKRGLIELGLLEPGDVADWSLGSIPLKAPVILFETLCWAIFAAGMGALLVRVVTAVMYTYPIFPALAISVAFCLTLPGIGKPSMIAESVPIPTIGGGLVAALTMVQWVSGFLAPSGLLGADWGASSRSQRDVTLGGLVGIVFASTILAALSLGIVSNACGGPQAEAPIEPQPATESAEARLARLLGGGSEPVIEPGRPVEVGEPSLGAAVQYGLGGPVGGMILLTLALGLLGPCVYAPFLIAKSAGNIWNGVKPLPMAMASVLPAWILVAVGWVDSPTRIFGWMGAVFAPIAGAIGADFARQRGRWPGTRPGWRLSAVGAWVIGLVVGLAPEIGLPWAQPATILAFGAAFLTELILSSFSTWRQPRSSVDPGSAGPPASPLSDNDP